MIYIEHVHVYTPNISNKPACAFMLHQYIQYIYVVYTIHLLVYATDIACTSCCFREAHELQVDQNQMEKAFTGDRIYSFSCDLGVRYPTLLAVMNTQDFHLCKSVRFNFNGYSYHMHYAY